MKHTKTPWKIEQYNQIEGPLSEWIATCEHSSAYCVPKEVALANAAHIVKCVNGWDAQADMLREAVEMLKEAQIQIKNFYCDGTHAAKGCEACIFQNQVTEFHTKASAAKDGE